MHVKFGSVYKITVDNRIGVGAGKLFGVRRIFARFPQMARKVFVRLFPKFSLTKIMKIFFWYDLQKTVFVYYIFGFGEKSQSLGAIFARIFVFSGISSRVLARFSTN